MKPNNANQPTATMVWRKSSRSPSTGNAQNCVELAKTTGRVFVRDSTLGPQSPLLSLPVDELRALKNQLS